MPDDPIDPIALLRPRRKIAGVSAVLLPFAADGGVDWASLRRPRRRTADAGLTPAVNMDTGYVHLLDDAQRLQVLERTRGVLGGRPFVAGAFVGDRPGAAFDRDAYLRRIDAIQRHGGSPVVFQSHGLTGLPDDRLIDAYADLGKRCDRFIAFELGPVFAPFGKVYSLEVYRGPARRAAVHRRQAFLAQTRPGMEAADPARPGAARFPRLHRQRPGHRHGDVRQRLPARPQYVRPGPVRPARRPVGGRRPGVSTN